MKREIETSIHSTSYTHNRIATTEMGENWTIMSGYVATKHGFVALWVSNLDGYQRSEIKFIHKGQLYYENRSGKPYSKRYLITLCKRFAERIESGMFDD